MSTNTTVQNGLARALRFSLIVGTILVMINQSSRVFNGPYDLDLAIRTLLTYLTPFLVSLITSSMTSNDAKVDQLKMQNELDASVRFPTMNPSPVLRISESDGRLIFGNKASEPVCVALGISRETCLTNARLETLATHAHAGTSFEINHQGITYELFPVLVADHGFFNVYGKDITATRALTRFPAMNPNPVLRVARIDGSLRFTNESARPVCEGLDLDNDTPLTAARLSEFKHAAESKSLLEVECRGRVYALSVIDVPGFGFLNAYGTDITAQRALTRFPAMNPNPVLRVARDTGELRFQNGAANDVCLGLNLNASNPLSREWLDAFKDGAQTGLPVKTSYQDRHFELKVVDVDGFDFLNAYGRDVTAQYLVDSLNKENQRLLRNVLPTAIIDRLQKGEELIADHITEMSVLFADLVGFTELSSKLAPEALLTILNDLFSAFDTLAEKHQLEKIKTIGDAYMVVGGLDNNPMHLQQIMALALDMQTAIDHYNHDHSSQTLEIRIGIHVGTGVAGVIGIKKFIYDVWGDTVNTASRMESTGIPGRIQVTQEVVEQLSDAYQFEPRGAVEIKGKGMMETFLVIKN